MQLQVLRQLRAGTMAAVVVLVVAPLALADVEPPGTSRDRLAFDELMADEPNRDGPIHNDYFMPVGETAPARHELEGILEFAPIPAFLGGNRFPDFSAAFYTVDGYLVPVERDVIRSPSLAWDIVLSPGRVWSEPGDNGWSRASFPFVLVGRAIANSHNGIATFLYKEDSVSNLQFQIVQESTHSGSRFDAWSRVPLTYVPGAIDEAPSLEDAFVRELEQRIPTEPLASLLTVDDLVEIDRGLLEVTVTGLLDNGVLYRSPCQTRFGDFPYCDDMRHHVYSVAKTATAALALLWLAEKYGPGVFDLKIVDYLDVTADHDGWNDVTFRDAINMATGIGDKAPERTDKFYADNRHAQARFLGADAASEKLEAAFLGGNYDWGAGEVVRYNDMHTFVLAAAMDAYLKKRGRSKCQLVGSSDRGGSEASRYSARTASAYARIGRWTGSADHGLGISSHRRRTSQDCSTLSGSGCTGWPAASLCQRS